MDNIDVEKYLDLNKVNEIKAILSDKFFIITTKYRSTGEKSFLEMETFLANSDYEAIRINIHTLKGSSGNLGATEMYHACLLLEQELLEQNYKNIKHSIEKINRLFLLSANALETCNEM